jgi:ABC-type xylose transport system permease subunit
VGNGWELDAIAGAVIGGVSLYGGEGRILGMVFGILLLMPGQAGPRRIPIFGAQGTEPTEKPTAAA